VATHLLDDPAWHALDGEHARLAEVVGSARRYRPDVSPFGGMGGSDDDAWASLAKLVSPGGSALLVRRVPVQPPVGWGVVRRVGGSQMVLDAPIRTAEPALPIRRLVPADVPRMLDLIAVAQPGPFEPRTIEMGTYLGVFDGDDLVAMAGERMHPPGHTEISAVCTHPDARGRGLAASLTAAIAEGIFARGETPFLHVAHGNDNAKRLYERLGFALRTEMQFALVEAPR
jgi:ribosomal protein S18 acetylase RimI-like enzyme